MNVQEVLKRLVEIAVKSLNAENALQAVGFDSTPYFDIYGSAADAIYYLIGEKTNTFDESVTYTVLHSDQYSNDQRVGILMYEYERNNNA